jgi:hypothetical protein
MGLCTDKIFLAIEIRRRSNYSLNRKDESWYTQNSKDEENVRD